MRSTPTETGRRIRESRWRLKLTCQSLAAMAGTATSTIWKIENGQMANPSQYILDRIERALDQATSLAIHSEPKPIGSDTVTINGQAITLMIPDESWTDLDWREICTRRLKRLRVGSLLAMRASNQLDSGDNRCHLSNIPTDAVYSH